MVIYRGFCLIASAVLPIESQSLVYRCKNAGTTMEFVNDDPDIVKLLSDALHLKSNVYSIVFITFFSVSEHSVHTKTGKQEIYGPIDMELHKISNGYYILDAARLLPPMHPKYWYQLLRTTLLYQYL